MRNRRMLETVIRRIENNTTVFLILLTAGMVLHSCGIENQHQNSLEENEIEKASELVFLVSENLEVKYKYEENEEAIEDITLINEILERFTERIEDMKIIIKVESNKAGTDSVVHEVMNELQKNKISKFSLITPDENK